MIYDFSRPGKSVWGTPLRTWGMGAVLHLAHVPAAHLHAEMVRHDTCRCGSAPLEPVELPGNGCRPWGQGSSQHAIVAVLGPHARLSIFHRAPRLMSLILDEPKPAR